MKTILNLFSDSPKFNLLLYLVISPLIVIMLKSFMIFGSPFHHGENSVILMLKTNPKEKIVMNDEKLKNKIKQNERNSGKPMLKESTHLFNWLMIKIQEL